VLRDVRLIPPCQHYDSAPYHFETSRPVAAVLTASVYCLVLQLYFPPHLSWSHSATFLQKVWILRRVHEDGGILLEEGCIGIHWCRLRMARKRKVAKSWIEWKIFSFSYDVEKTLYTYFSHTITTPFILASLYGTIPSRYTSTTIVDTWSRMNGNSIYDRTPPLTRHIIDRCSTIVLEVVKPELNLKSTNVVAIFFPDVFVKGRRGGRWCEGQWWYCSRLGAGRMSRIFAPEVLIFSWQTWGGLDLVVLSLRQWCRIWCASRMCWFSRNLGRWVAVVSRFCRWHPKSAWTSNM